MATSSTTASLIDATSPTTAWSEDDHDGHEHESEPDDGHGTETGLAQPPVVDRSSADTPKTGQLPKRRRRHKAAGARVAATGLGAGALLGIVGAFGAHAAPTGATTKAAFAPGSVPATVARRPVPTTTPTTIVWRTVHRVVVVTDPPVSRARRRPAARRRKPSRRPIVPSAPPAVGSPAPAPAAPTPVAAPAPAPAPAARARPGAPGVQRFEVSRDDDATRVVTHRLVGDGCDRGADDRRRRRSRRWSSGPSTDSPHLEASWSRFRPESELRGLDGVARRGSRAASPDLIDAVGRALSLWYVTDGRFDPTVRRARSRRSDTTARFATSRRTGPALVHPLASGAGLRRRAVSTASGATVTLPDGVALDLGGIGKGLAADLVATGLVETGRAGACVGLGGDVRVSRDHPADGDAWPIRVEDPLDESRTLCTRRLATEAIVTSTTRFRRWTRRRTALHHIIDPATGAPADRGVAAVVAQADEAWWAEGVAKAALVAGVDAGPRAPRATRRRGGGRRHAVGEHHSTDNWERA